MVPDSPKLYHITHVDNLPSIIQDGGLWCDSALLSRGGPSESIGISEIKQRRLALPVKCNPGQLVGGCVPFYFCPRSIMLYLIYRGNHPNLPYRGGQGPILHLELDLHEVVDWADAQPRRWAFTFSNAGARYAEFRNKVDQLRELNWQAIGSRDFQDPATKESKQAEFLVEEFVPWHLVRRIGVQNATVYGRVIRHLEGAVKRPEVDISPDWYY